MERYEGAEGAAGTDVEGESQSGQGGDGNIRGCDPPNWRATSGISVLSSAGIGTA